MNELVETYWRMRSLLEPAFDPRDATPRTMARSGQHSRDVLPIVAAILTVAQIISREPKQ